MRFLPVVVVLLLSGCASRSGWDGEIQQWGAMRRVLGEGRTEGRVALADLAGSEDLYAVGALAALEGEVTIVDGQVWIAQADGESAPSRLLGDGELQATLLVAARVPVWRTYPLNADVSPLELDGYVSAAAASHGIDTSRPFPFLVKGPVTHLEAHVVNGMCPMQAEPDSDHAPVRFHLETVDATLVGIHAEGQAGVLTHHGSTTHIHVVVPGQRTRMGHVESVGLGRGASLWLPVRE